MIFVLIGPIKHWWDGNWDTPAHREYVAHREAVDQALQAQGHLVYRPHEAFKGPWDESAQLVNDVAISCADAIINLTPPGVPSEGTSAEVLRATSWRKVIMDWPPGQKGLPVIALMPDGAEAV